VLAHFQQLALDTMRQQQGDKALSHQAVETLIVVVQEVDLVV